MWLYNNTPVTSLEEFPNHEALLGFAYKITNLKTGTIYIGRKNFYSTRKKALTNKEIAFLPDKRCKKHKHIKKESDWQSYWSSSKELQDDLKKIGEKHFKREILEVACTLKQIGYLELKYMFHYNVLETNSYNANILGKIFKSDIESFCKL